MTEKVQIPPEGTKTNWNSDGVTYPSTDPGASKRATGFKPKDVPVPGPGEIITADDQNWLHGLSMQMHTWFRAYLPREWTELSEAIAAASARDLLRVCPPSGGDLYNRLYIHYTTATTITGGGAPKGLQCDGEQLYYFGGTSQNYIVVADPSDMSETTEISVGYPVVSMAAEGKWIWYAANSASHVGLRRYDRDGTNPSGAIGSSYNYVKMASNGNKVVAIAPNGALGDVHFFTAATPAYDGSASTGSLTTGLEACTIDATQCYVAGKADGSGNNLWCYNLSTRALVWQTSVIGSTAPTYNDMVTDGDFVYIATTDTGTGGASVHCHRRTDGKLLWSTGLPSGVDAEQLAVDAQHLYIIDNQATPDMYMIRKDAITRVNASADFDLPYVEVATNQLDKTERICCDGTTVYGASGSAVRRLDCGYPTRTFLLVNGDDPNRKPIYTLAVPVDS